MQAPFTTKEPNTIGIEDTQETFDVPQVRDNINSEIEKSSKLPLSIAQLDLLIAFLLRFALVYLTFVVSNLGIDVSAESQITGTPLYANLSMLEFTESVLEVGNSSVAFIISSFFGFVSTFIHAKKDKISDVLRSSL
jgi:hypothetical protein